MTSITSWVRLEPRARDPELVTGVEARLHDPLWLLGRQLQLGELTGSDRGSAIAVRTRTRTRPIDAVRGGGDWGEFDPERSTLSAAALAPDADRRTARPELARRARAGRQLCRLLVGADLGDAGAAFIAHFPFAIDGDQHAALDDADRAFLAAVRARVPDGDAVASALGALADDSALVPEALGFESELRVAVTGVCRAWLAWRASFERAAPAPAWIDTELAYRFAARAKELVLDGSRRAAGPVQWYDVDATSTEDGAQPAASVESISIPAPVRYRGMPARRYWELEDGAVRWPSIDTGPGDVGRLLFIEYGLTFGADWMVVPLEVAVPSVAAVESLVVVDTFGVATAVPPTREIDGPKGTWRFLELSRQTGDPEDSLLLIAPAVEPVAGPARAEVDFVRDETANLVWAVERTVRGADGRPRTIAPTVDERPPPELRTYRVGVTVGDENHPYRPRSEGAEPALVLAAIPGRPVRPRADLPKTLRAHALSRGTRVVTRAELSRSPDGSILLIERREVSAAPVVPPVALDFDHVEGGS